MTYNFLWSQIPTKFFIKLSLIFCLQTFSFIYYWWIVKYLFNAFDTLIKWMLFNLFDLIYFLRRTHHLEPLWRRWHSFHPSKTSLSWCTWPHHSVSSHRIKSLTVYLCKTRGTNVKLNQAILGLYPLYTYYIARRNAINSVSSMFIHIYKILYTALNTM